MDMPPVISTADPDQVTVTVETWYNGWALALAFVAGTQIGWVVAALIFILAK